MAKRALVSTPRTFDELVAAVREALIEGQSRVDRAYLETYRTTGLLIEAHLQSKERAGYGEKVVPQLARALKVDERLLYRCLRFVREYPILAHGPELGWTHYRLLLDVPDKIQRQALESAARRHRWTGPELERRVREVNAINVTPIALANGGAAAATHKPLVPHRGTPGLHLIVDRGDGPAVDLGFKLYWPLTPEQTKRFAKGDIVRLASDDSLRRADDATRADLFTYAATLRRVVDGDTLVVALEVSPGVFIEQKLRLRGLDCPEMATSGGKAAQRFVEGLVAQTSAIAINTTKPDKYDRYLADVFLSCRMKDVAGLVEAGPGSATPAAVRATSAEIFLNNALLENGHAVRKDEWEFGDWEPGLMK